MLLGVACPAAQARPLGSMAWMPFFLFENEKDFEMLR